MTRVAALDTSTWWGSVALLEGTADGPAPVAEGGLRVHDSHAARVLSLLEALLAQAGWTRSDVDVWVATRGPGSFTGIRVGLATVRGLSLGSARPCIGVGTLDALAEARGPAALDRVPLLDAGRQEVYGARFDASGHPPGERLAPWVGPPERALEGGDAIVFGPGAEIHRERLRRAGWSGEPSAVGSVAAAAARIALALGPGGAGPGDGMSPLYVRPPDAKLRRGRE